LVALDRLGGSPSRLKAFYAASIPSLVGFKPAAHPLHPIDAMGNSDHFPSVLLYFQQAIVEDGPANVLRRWVPELITGIAAASFHGLIRLGYAIETSNNTEIASALALWTTAFTSLGPPGDLVDEMPAAMVKRLSKLIANRPVSPGLIVDRMTGIAPLNLPQYSESQPRHLGLSDVAGFAISAYASFDDFTLLHAVTATHAFRLIVPFITDSALATRYLWRSIMIAALSTGLPLHNDWPKAGAHMTEWADIAARAIESDDEHVIKLVYTAFAEFRIYADPLYQFVAMRQVASVSTIALAG
jgi:Questin oxidase-like